MHASQEGPGAPFPPTLFFVVAFGVALGLHEQRPLVLFTPGFERWRTVIGGGLITAGLAVFWWGMSTFARARTGILLERPASELVMRGPYRWSRNPQYVGFVASYIGLAVIANSLWPVIVLPVALALLVPFVIRREERYLRSRFGDQYDAYCRRVKRWL
jgi:protein-S-isoprenylcysteine O-methyltransferase Ste14